MSALLTHAAIGGILAFALGYRGKWLLLGPLLAIFPDADHLSMYWDQPVLRSRETLHNAFACVALPLLIFAILRWRRVSAEKQYLALTAPVLLSSHLLLDILSLDPYGGAGRAKLFYPVSTENWKFVAWDVNTLDPRAVTTVTLIMLILLAAVAIGVFVARRASQHNAPKTILGAYAVSWLLLFPALAGAGALTDQASFASAYLVLEDAVIQQPAGRLIATYYHAGGENAGGLRVELVANGTVLTTARLTTTIEASDRGAVSVGVTDPDRNITRATARLVGPANHTYAQIPVRFERGHVNASVALAASNEPNRTLVQLTLAGVSPIPAHALALRLIENGNVTKAIITTVELSAGANLTFEFPVGSPGVKRTVEARAVDDNYVYARINLGDGSS